jgi:hypothetical protein
MDVCTPQAAGGSFIGENGLVVMAGAESMEWYPTHQTCDFHVFGGIPFQLLL